MHLLLKHILSLTEIMDLVQQMGAIAAHLPTDGPASPAGPSTPASDATAPVQIRAKLTQLGRKAAPLP